MTMNPQRHLSKAVLCWIRIFLILSCAVHGSDFDDEKFDGMIEKMEADVLELARKLEEIYPSRCDENVMSTCTKANHDHCLSSFPNPSCPGGEDRHNPVCGEASTCSLSYSYDTSVVILPDRLTYGSDKNPKDPQVIESICFSRKLDDFFIQKREEDKGYWEEFGYEPTAMYFASHTGAMRLYPARTYQKCGKLDPPLRDWYIAASSGPKNVVLVLDISTSMNDNAKIDMLKEAASRIISTLSTSDRIAIVPFESEPRDITDNNGLMIPATKENVEKLTNRTQELLAHGGTNFYQAFDKAFDILDASFPEDATVKCNTAIIFLTDGERTVGKPEQDVIEMVNTRLAVTEATLEHPIYLFTFSIPGTVSEINEFPSQLACSVPNGVWAQIDDEKEIVESLSSYYKLFALGLGNNINQDFVAWVEPYIFASMEEYGTTASAPVYDRSKEPHLFLGVVAIDFLMPALDAALGVTDGTSDESIKRIVQRSSATCPRLEVSECVLESYRRQGKAKDVALCKNNNCTEDDFAPIEEEQCSTISDYSKDLWVNVLKKGVSYVEGACCRVGFTSVLDMTCPNPDDGDDPPLAVILGVALGGVFVLSACAFYGVYFIGGRTDDDGSISINPPPTAPPYRGALSHVPPAIPPPPFDPSSSLQPVTTGEESPGEKNNDPSPMENSASSNHTSENSMSDDVESS